MKFALTLLGFLLPSLVMASDIAEDTKPRLTFQLGRFIPKEYPDFEPVTLKAQLGIAGPCTTDEKVIQHAEESIQNARSFIAQVLMEDQQSIQAFKDQIKSGAHDQYFKEEMEKLIKENPEDFNGTNLDFNVLKWTTDRLADIRLLKIDSHLSKLNPQ